MVHKEAQGFGAGIAGPVLTLGRDKEIIPGFDGLPGAVDIGLAATLDYKDRICLLFVLMDGGFRTGRNLNQADTGRTGFLAGDKHRGLDIVESGVLGENHLPLGIKLCLHGSLLIAEFCRKQPVAHYGMELYIKYTLKSGFCKGNTLLSLIII